MSIENAIETFLDADATLAALLTGGIHAWDELPRDGINETQMSSVFTTGILKPTAVVRARDSVPFGRVGDNQLQRRTMRTPIEIYLHVDADAGYTTLESAKDRIFVLLHKKPIPNTGNLRWVNERKFRDFTLNNAASYRLEYDLISYRRG